MLELMAILIILGLLATIVGKQVFGKIDQAKVATTKVKLKVLHEAIQQFRIDTGRLPAEEEGLFVLIEQPVDVENWDPEGYIESTEIPLDGWNNEFIFELSPESGKAFVIKSLGADNQEGGEGNDADLFSTDAD